MSLHDELAHLTSAQPAQPGDRLTAVTGKARRMKRTRNALALAAVVAVAAPVGVLAATSGGEGTGTSYAGSGFASWPDRTVDGLQQLGEGAEAAFAEQVVNLRLGDAQSQVTDVRWLYRGSVGVGGEARVLAALTAKVDGTDVVAVGYAKDEDVDETGRAPGGRLPWGFLGRKVSGADRVLTAYVPFTTTEGVRDVLFTLGAPGVKEVTWTQEPLPYAPTDGVVRTGTANDANGVFVIVPGALVGPAEVEGATPLGQPELEDPGDFDLQGQQTVVSSTWGTLELNPDTRNYESPHFALPMDVAGATATLHVRCYGGGTLQIRQLEQVSDPAQADREVGSSVATCDGGENLTLMGTKAQITPTSIQVSSDRLTAFRIGWVVDQAL